MTAQRRFCKKNLVSPLNYDEIEDLVKEKSITEKQFYIWTDFERHNMTHFRISTSFGIYTKYCIFDVLNIRSKSDERFPSISRNNIRQLYYTSALDFEIEAQKWFFSIVLAHGDGRILNIPPPGHLTLGGSSDMRILRLRNLNSDDCNLSPIRKPSKVRILHRFKMLLVFVFVDILIY